MECIQRMKYTHRVLHSHEKLSCGGHTNKQRHFKCLLDHLNMMNNYSGVTKYDQDMLLNRKHLIILLHIDAAL